MIFHPVCRIIVDISEAWNQQRALTLDDLTRLLSHKIHETDFENAKIDILPFVRDKQAIDLWTKDFFLEIVQQVHATVS